MPLLDLYTSETFGAKFITTIILLLYPFNMGYLQLNSINKKTIVTLAINHINQNTTSTP